MQVSKYTIIFLFLFFIFALIIYREEVVNFMYGRAKLTTISVSHRMSLC